MADILCFVCLVLVLWKASCLFLRAKRRRYLASLSATQDALLLYKLTNYVEFGFLCHKALEFVLFRSFAIPSISKLLQSTQQFSPSSVLKRYDDTDILTQEFVLHHVDSRRGSLAIRRLNFIHAQYKIPNTDLLYNLSLFVLGPIRFTDKFGNRNWTEGEKQAQFVVWHDIGTRMGIKHIPHSLEELELFSRRYEAQNMVYSESNRVIGDATLDLLLSKAPAQFVVWHDIGTRMGIKHIPHSLEELELFSRQYEAQNMVYSESNRVIGDATLDLLLSKARAPFHPLARRVAYALFDEKIVKAMGYPRQPYWLVWSVEGVIRLCGGTLVRWCLPPRPMHWSTQRIPLHERQEEQELYKLRYDDYKPCIYPNSQRIKSRRWEMHQAGEWARLATEACYVP